MTRGKFRKLLPIPTSKHLPLVVRGKVYSTCVRSAMLHYLVFMVLKSACAYDVLDDMDMSEEPVVVLTRSLTWLSPVLVDGEDQGKLGQSVSRIIYRHTI